MDRISSRQNPVVKRFRELARAGGSDDHVLLDGEHLVAEALRSSTPLELAAFSESAVRERLASLHADIRRAGVKTMTVTESVLAAMSPVRHPSGVVAIGRRTAATVEDVLGRAPQIVVFVTGVQDPGNVGAIVRAAEACGASGLVVGPQTADPFGWKALRGGMGSTFRLPIAVTADLVQAATRARQAGIRLVATVPRAGTKLPHADLRQPSAILLGGEGPGLPQDLIDTADERVTIPMQQPVESLNVAIAAGIVLYEAWRQRNQQEPSRS
jgi:TrmH family RNA methyltransferase